MNPKTGKRTPTAGYSLATIAHALTVVHGFYYFRIRLGRGPVLSPVPDSAARRMAQVDRSPIEAPVRFRRARLIPISTKCSIGCGARETRLCSAATSIQELGPSNYWACC
ncbi:hypothetical protein [Streptomyces flavidovirens]|uniref:hypothetical protein n=1 Tax=Streptomyces flavidovirens TaxID=67298 RepID=UPI0012FEDA28|nr:hypothetical protein [Streptomyces flavidovirens]